MEPITETARKIDRMEIRGAGRIARAAAASLRDLAQQLDVKSLEEFNSRIKDAAETLLATRPTAVSLSNAEDGYSLPCE